MLSFQKKFFFISILIFISASAWAVPPAKLPSLNPDPEMPLIPTELLDIEMSIEITFFEPLGIYFLLSPARGAGLGKISSGFGWRGDRMHNGIDIPLTLGTPIVAAKEGTVKRAESVSGYGRLVAIDHGNNLETRYAHCSMLAVSVGEKVFAGQIIGYAGNTGRSTGSHLHFEVLINGVAHNPTSFIFAF